MVQVCVALIQSIEMYKLYLREPVAFAEVYCNDSCSLTKVRRLHLKVVDLERAKSVGSDVYWQFQKMNVSARYEECFNTLPVPMSDSDCPLRCRYVYGYGVDGSDRPSYLLWPRRGSDGHFWLMEPRTGDYFDPAKANFIAPLGVEHFFDAFALEQKRDLREAAATALELDRDDTTQSGGEASRCQAISANTSACSR